MSVIVFLANFLLAAAAPQVFTDTYNFCQFEYGDKKLEFPDKLWTVSTRDFNLHFSFCKSVQATCRQQTSSCLIQKKNSQIIDLGREFTWDEESDDFTLKSSSREKCRQNPSKNYTLVVTFLCSGSIKPKPRLMSSDDDDNCTFEVTMMEPGCRPKCTEIIESAYLLDIRSLKKSIRVDFNSTKFSLSLCGSNRDCLGDISACQITENDRVPLASIESQYLNYDVGKNELTARGRYKHEKVERDVQVLIKCNWTTDVVNPVYKKPQTQGKHYKFELESSFGCIKLPHKCTLSSIGNFQYNLTRLYRFSGWEVNGVPQGRIFVNICGPLNQQRSICKDQYSQVCHLNNNNYMNRGSILSSLKAHDDVITATFISGSTCRENATFFYNTDIELRCAKSEKGPVFKEYTRQGCVLSLVWETPRACPIDRYTGQNCYMNDRVSNRNLNKLYTETDNIYFLAPNRKTRLIYNLCGATHETCNGYSNVSFCLKTEQRETVIGWDQRELISENGLLRLELQGSLCPNMRNKGETIVHFVCDYRKPSLPTNIEVIEDGCKFNVTIFTPLACFAQNSFQSCVDSTDNLTYDLSPLVRKSNNYIITEGTVDYVFNLCGPIVSAPGALCGGDTMFCWNNKSEINVKKKFVSLGGVGKPRLVNNSLILEAKMGSYCPGLGYYMSVIYFECSKEKFSPIFLSNENCVHKFKWKTPEACPTEKNCVVEGSKPDVNLDLTQLQKKSVTFNVDNKTNLYEFHLCQDTYTKYSDDSNNGTHFLKRHYFTYDGRPYLVLDLETKCDNGSTIRKVNFDFLCSETIEERLKQTSFEECVLNVTIYTHIVCPMLKEKFVYSVVENVTQKTTQSQRVVENLKRSKRNCTLINPYTGYEFSLNKIETEELPQSNNSVVLNLSGNSTKCSDIFCKNHVKKVEKGCPVPFFNYTGESVVLHFLGDNCDSAPFELEIVLKCNQTKSVPRILKDKKCEFTVLYNLPEACLLLKQEIIAAGHSAALAGGVIGTLIVLGAVIATVIYLRKRQCEYRRYFPFSRVNKRCIPIYTRDSTL